MQKFISNNVQDTIKFGKFLDSKLQKGDIVVLTGDLGSGKTKLTEGILSYFNMENEICSPTFTIVNEYTNSKNNIYHFDVYRLESEDEFYAIGGEEYFSKGICIIEWGEMIENILPKNYLKIKFSRNSENENARILNLEFIGNFRLRGEDFEDFKC